MPEQEMKTYLVEFKNGTKQKITVPANWKVTFGPAAKGNRGDRTGLQMPLALRFYESEVKQRAIFTDVVSFRDTSINIEEMKIEIQEKEGYMECDGVKKKTTFQAKATSWVNPDNDANGVPQLPSDTSMFDISKAIKL